MSRPDKRPAILAGALFADDLTYAERIYLAVVATVKAEHVDGQRRHGSRSMDARGHYSLHLDYLAGAMASSTGAVKKIQRTLVAKSYLSTVHPATFGRPIHFHALDVRGDKNGRLTSGEKVTPYGLGAWAIRDDFSAPLTYKAPTHPDQAPTSRGYRAAVLDVDKRSNEGAEPPEAPASLAGCAWHDEEHPCPQDCRNHPTNREATA